MNSSGFARRVRERAAAEVLLRLRPSFLTTNADVCKWERILRPIVVSEGKVD